MDAVLFNTHDVVLLLTMSCCFISIFIFLLQRSDKRYYNLILTLFFVSSACIPLDTLINYGAAVRPWALHNLPNIFFVFEFGTWIQAPLAYWLIKSIVEKDFSFNRFDYCLALPFLLAASHQSMAYHSLPTETKIVILQTLNISNESITVFFVQFSRDAFRTYVAWLCVVTVRTYFDSVHPRQNNKIVAGYEWLALFAVGFLVMNVWSSLISLTLLTNAYLGFNIPVAIVGLLQNYAILVFFASVIVLYSRNGVRVKDIKPLTKKAHKPQTTYAINPAYISSLEPLMEKDKIFTNPDLTLDLLAEKMGISPRTLSGVINGHYGCNFFEYVNKHRIQEAKRLLESQEFNKTSMLDIMYEVGFNSKATFNGFFKKIEGMTPSQYRKQNLESAKG